MKRPLDPKSKWFLRDLYDVVAEKNVELRQDYGREVGFVILHSVYARPVRLLLLGERPNGPHEPKNDQQRPPKTSRNSLRRGNYLVAWMATALFERAKILRKLDDAQFVDLNFFRDVNVSRGRRKSAYTRKSARFCKPLVAALIEHLSPRWIVTLGDRALLDLLRLEDPSWKLKGSTYDRIKGGTFRYKGILVTPLMHLSGRGSKAKHFGQAVHRLRRDSRAT